MNSRIVIYFFDKYHPSHTFDPCIQRFGSFKLHQHLIRDEIFVYGLVVFVSSLLRGNHGCFEEIFLFDGLLVITEVYVKHFIYE